MDALQAIANVKTEINISVYSRHSDGCENERAFLNCGCPKWAEYYVAGKQKKVSLKTRDRETAIGKAREMGNSFARAARGEVQPPPVATGSRKQ